MVAGDPADQRTRDLLTACRRSTIAGLTIVPVSACHAESWECLEGRKELSEPQALLCVGTGCLAPAKTVADVTARLTEVDKQLMVP